LIQVDANSPVLRKQDTLRAGTRIVIPDLPMDSGTIKLEGTPVSKTFAKSDLKMGGLPQGLFTLRIESRGMIYRSLDSVQLTAGDELDLNRIAWSLDVSTILPEIQLGLFRKEGMVLQSKEAALWVTDTTLQMFRLGSDIQGSKMTAFSLSSIALYLGSDQELLVIQNDGRTQKSPISQIQKIVPLTGNRVGVISDYAGVSLFNGFDSIGLQGAQLPMYSWQVTSLFADSDTSLYMGSRLRGVHRWVQGDSIQTDTSFLGAKSLIINDLDYDGTRLWAATSNGLISREEGLWSDLLRGLSIQELQRDSKGNLWALSQSGRLYLIRNSEPILIDSVSSASKGLSEGRGFLWITTSQGGQLKPLD
jgi:hypothetical protein